MSRDVWLRLIASLVILAISLGLMAALAEAQDVNVALTVTPYLGGHFKYGEWLPLRVGIENNGSDLDAEIRAEVAGSSGQAVYAAPAPLPAGARKEVVLYVLPPTFAQALNVRLVQGDRVLAEAEAVPVSAHPHSEYLVGVIAPETDAFAVLNGLEISGRAQARLIPLALNNLPDRFEALRTLDCLILTGVDTLTLEPAKAEALQAWLQEGGRLLIGGGAGARRVLAGLPEALQPAQIDESVTLAHLDGLADYAGVPVQVPGPFVAALPASSPASGYWPIVRQDDRMLLAQKPLGKGWATYLALDPAVSPFDAWAGALPFWKKLLEPGAALPPNIPPDIPLRTLEAEQMNNALTNLPELDLPSVRWLAMLLGLYILLVGPVNYLLLRRWRRLAWAWLTIPALTLAFSAGSYGVGYGLRGSEVIINQISILPLAADDSPLAVRSYVGLFSPTRQVYNVRVGGEALISPMSYDPGRPWDSTQPVGYTNLDVLQGNPVQVRSLGVNQWAMQSFRAETMLDGTSLDLDIALRVEDDAVRGTLRNGLDRPLRGMVLVSGNRFAELGDLGPGEQKEIEAVLEGGSGGAPFPYALFEKFYRGPGSPPRELILRQSILEAYLNTGWGMPTLSSELKLLAWTDLNPLAVQVSGVRASQQQTTLVVAPVPLAIEDGRVELPLGLLAGRIVTTEGDSGDCGAGRGYIGSGKLTWEYRLPAALRGIDPTSLQLKVTPADSPMLQLPQLALYDWTADEWVPLANVESGQAYPVDHPERFVNPTDSMIRLQTWRDDAMGMGGCYQIDLGLEGEFRQ